MRRGLLLRKLFPMALMANIYALGFSVLLSVALFQRFYYEQKEHDLLVRGQILSELVKPLIQSGDMEALNRVCKEQGESLKNRILITDAYGTVIARSTEGATKDSDLVHASVSLTNGNEFMGVLKIAVFRSTLRDAFSTIYVHLILVATAVLLFAGLVSWFYLKRMTIPSIQPEYFEEPLEVQL